MVNPLYAIETAELTKYFNRGRLEVLHKVNLQVKPGEIVALIGPNGAGKTTLLKILATLILPTSGTAYIQGCDVTKNETLIKRNIGLVTGDERSFYWRLSARQNLEFFASLYNLTRKQTKERLIVLFDLFNIENPDKRFQEYSAGLRQRFALIRSLLNDAGLLLMDEPTKSLDPNSSKNLRGFIKDELVQRLGKTVLFTTHRMEEIEDFCDSVALLDKGSLRAFGKLTQEEIYRCF